MKKAIKFLSITYFISWISWFLLAVLLKFDIINQGFIYGALFMLGGFGPTIATIICLEDKSFKSILNYIFHTKKGGIKYFLILSLLFIGIMGATQGLNQEIPPFAIPIIIISATFIGGGNEELGWRGMLEPVLQTRFPYITSVTITGIFWVCWHIPMWFIEGSVQQNIPFYLFFIQGILLSFWLSCIYKKTNSVFLCMVFHGLANTLLSVFKIEVNFLLITGYLALTMLSLYMVYQNKTVKSEV